MHDAHDSQIVLPRDAASDWCARRGEASEERCPEGRCLSRGEVSETFRRTPLSDSRTLVSGCGPRFRVRDHARLSRGEVSETFRRTPLSDSRTLVSGCGPRFRVRDHARP